MVIPDVEWVWKQAGHLLDAATSALTDNGLVPPEHRYVSLTEPPWDCEQLTVHTVKLDVNRASKSAERGMPARIKARNYAVIFRVTLVACVPTSDSVIPTVADLSTNAHGWYQRGWAMFQGLNCVIDEVFDGGCQTRTVGPLTPHGPTGGYGAFTIDVDVNLL